MFGRSHGPHPPPPPPPQGFLLLKIILQGKLQMSTTDRRPYMRINNNNEQKHRLLTQQWCFFCSETLRPQIVHNPLQGFGWLVDLMSQNTSRWNIYLKLNMAAFSVGVSLCFFSYGQMWNIPDAGPALVTNNHLSLQAAQPFQHGSRDRILLSLQSIRYGGNPEEKKNIGGLMVQHFCTLSINILIEIHPFLLPKGLKNVTSVFFVLFVIKWIGWNHVNLRHVVFVQSSTLD